MASLESCICAYPGGQAVKLYKDHYEVVIIGAGLAGLACALSLQKAGIKDILILEKNLLPGGLATSFVRNGFEIETTLHELMGVGTEEKPGTTERLFREMGIQIDWLRVPECYRLSVPEERIDVTLHDGYERAAREIDEACPGAYETVLEFLRFSRRLCDVMNKFGGKSGSRGSLRGTVDFLRMIGYSADEAMTAFGLPERAKKLLTPYWLYLGNKLEDLPFVIYAFLLAEYFEGSHIPKGFSYEMGIRMAERAEKNGAQIEYRQPVEKILVKEGKVYGVRTARGDEIHCSMVVSGAYPDKVYTEMIEPLSEVPEAAVSFVNARQLSLTPVSVYMILEGTPEELGFTSYCTISSDTMDTAELFENLGQLGEPYQYLTSVCLNLANPECVPHGYTQFSITVLPRIDVFSGVKEEEYYSLKRKLADELIGTFISQTGIPDFRNRIVEIEVGTPMTASRYVGAFKGCVYGYLHTMSDHVVARTLAGKKEHFIKGLVFAGAHSAAGDGLAPALTNGTEAAKEVLRLIS